MKIKRKIASTMASQHPDHAGKPYWHNEEFISIQHEYKECFLSYSELGIDEYKWDWEGKLVDESVIEHLLGDYFDFFKDHQIGLDKFLTFRLPNPKIETEFRIGRAFIGMLSAAGLAKKIGLFSPPLFEVILPMTESSEEMIDIQEAFREISGLKHQLYRFKTNVLTSIEVIPLFEQISTIIRSDIILKKYLKDYKRKFGGFPSYLRPYVARSDPALNSGLIPTVIAIKIALSNYRKLSESTDIQLYPIIGSASLPFRGGLTPFTVEKFCEEYQGIKTALIQSAFRYDFRKEDVIKGIEKLNQLIPLGIAKKISDTDEKTLLKIITIFESNYKQTIEIIAPLINHVALFLPKRRERVQHIGLFGYSRGVGKVKLPRAIGFTGALYSLGIPPEIIGTGRGIKKIRKLGLCPLLEKFYTHLKYDLLQAGRYANKRALAKLAKNDSSWKPILDDVLEIERYLGIDLGPKSDDQKEHYYLTKFIHEKLEKNEKPSKEILKAAIARRSLG